MRVLFFNEGDLGTHIMGQGQLDAALRVGLAGGAPIQGRFARLGPMGGGAQALASRRVRPLSWLNLDFSTLRWHLVQSSRARAALRREMEEWPPDVVHVHSQSVALAMASTMRHTPVAVSVDTTVADWWAMPAWRPTGPLASISIAPSRLLERRALTRAAIVLAWTGWARRAVELTAPAAHVVEHHPGLDLDRYRAAPRRGRELPRLLFVGGRFVAKGGEDLLAALGSELGREVEVDLVTPADVPARPGVRVHRLTPSDPRLIDLQQQADVMCLPTYGDTNPWALLEAMACATPVISTTVGGIPDLLDNGRAGVLIPHGNPRALRQAVLGLLGDPTRRAELSARARRRCEERYDARRQFHRLVHLLEAVRQQDGPLRSRRRT